MSNGAPAVEFRSVRKSYGRFVAVADVSFAVRPGTLVTLLGPSGCGKTTTLRLIAGLDTVTSGTILIDGIDVTHRPVAERNVSMVFQSYALFPHMNVLRNVSYGLISSGLPRAEAEALAHDALTLVGLDGLATRLPSELSGGQQQRVAVARAVALRPAVLLLDEPLSNLDAKLRRHVREELRDLQQRLDLTAVYVTHDQSEAFAVSDRVILMEKARIAQDGSPLDLYREPASRFVADFVGEANIVEAMLRRRDENHCAIEIAGLTIDVPNRNLDDGVVEVAIRPEAVRIATIPDGQPMVAARLVRATFLGDRIEYGLDTPIGALFASDPNLDRLLAPGTSVFISFRPIGVAVLSRPRDGSEPAFSPRGQDRRAPPEEPRRT